MTGLISRYEALVASGELRSDPEQAAAAERLEQLQRELEGAKSKSGLFGKLFSRKSAIPRGVYLWGGVGRGKSMLMDLFHDSLKITEKRRVHFHAFMLEVHARLRKERDKEEGDPIPPVAAAIAAHVRYDEGVTVVTTSNRAPGALYKDGLNREHFLPFIAMIESELDVLPLNGPVDYRLERLAGLDTWHVPWGEDATAQVREAFFRLTDYSPEDYEHVPSSELDLGGGRKLHVPKCLKGVAVFSFRKLCGEARGAADYLAVAQTFHTVILVGIPRMGPDNRNEAARFVTLIDALYENKVKLFATANAEPEELYEAGDGRFEFERTISRLKEMQSDDYLAEGHGEA